ncbi:uncharacterized protein LOC143258511 isoform X4 [Tachypleus tridentatus]|uniref:uncharacterized protein LOC143258511 isoform X4 n=1 Tax=Tachypleus tridentatus TaxID=6853 RepID=UPI003FD56561
MFPVQQLEFCVSGDSDYKTELTKLYIPKGLLDEIISQIKLQETRTGIPEIPGYYKISNKYKWDPQRLKGYQGHNFDVKHVDNFHRSTSELTARVIQREYEKERRWQIQEKQLLGRPNDDFCKKTLVELKQCLSISQNEKLKNEEIKKHEVEMMKDHIHEELLWCKREKELTKELEMAKGMFFQLLDVRRMSTVMLGKLATFHQQKQELHQVIKQAVGGLCIDEQKEIKLQIEQIHDLKFQLHNELRRQEMFKRLLELEATEVQWRITILRLSKEDLVRQKYLTQWEAVHTQLLSLFQRFREREAAEDKEAFKQHQERLENVLTELLKKYWRKQHTKVFREERIHCMWGSGKNNQEGFENFWNPFLHKFYIVNAGFRCSKKCAKSLKTDRSRQEAFILLLMV